MKFTVEDWKIAYEHEKPWEYFNFRLGEMLASAETVYGYHPVNSKFSGQLPGTWFRGKQLTAKHSNKKAKLVCMVSTTEKFPWEK